MLITFNILTYDKIIQFEQTLVTQIRAQNTSQRQNSVRRFREGSRSTISEYHHSGRGRGSNAASHNSAQNHNTVGKFLHLVIWQISRVLILHPLLMVNYYVKSLANYGGYQLEFVSISRIINHMTCYKFECSNWQKIYF